MRGYLEEPAESHRASADLRLITRAVRSSVESNPLNECLFRYPPMSQQRPRLRRLLADELGECCDGDVEHRLDELQSLTDGLPDDHQSDLLAMKTLGNGTRYEIVRLLVAASNELCVCEITPLVDVSESAVSHALSDLTDAGLVTRRKDGTWRYYDTTDRAEHLIDTLDATREETA